MRRECRERFPRLRFPKKARVSDTNTHHGTCVTHVPWYISGSLTSGNGKTFPAFPGHAQPAILRIWRPIAWYWDAWPSCYTDGINAVRARQNGRHFADGTVIWIFFDEKCILIETSLKCTPKGSSNIPPSVLTTVELTDASKRRSPIIWMPFICSLFPSG